MRTKIAIFAAASPIALLLILLVVLRPTIPRKKGIFIIAGAASVVSLTIIYSILIHSHLSVRRRHLSISAGADTNPGFQFSILCKVAGLPVSFTYKSLETATKNFSTPIGRGSSGSVFRGILDDGTVVAVKRIDRLAEKGDRDFRSEITVIAGVQHINVVRLLGYCLNSDGSHRLLVYEFAPHGSLENWIFNCSGECLPWKVRVRVAVEVAKALAYLHNDCRTRVLHLDVKPENILLGEGFHALVADFGVSKMMGREESRVMTSLRGTRGYLAPEWLVGRGVTEKSDVYSYGMVLLEMVGGRRNCLLVGGRWSYFPTVVVEKIKQRRMMEVVDGRMGLGEGEEEEVMRMVHVALWCIQEEWKMRPSMEIVVDMLEGRLGVVEPPPETSMIMAAYLEDDMVEGTTVEVRRSLTPEDVTYSVLSGR